MTDKNSALTAPTGLVLLFAAVISSGLIGNTIDSQAQSAYDYPFCGVHQNRDGATSCNFFRPTSSAWSR